ncbi:MAG: four-helix bundle copper-binding protein [Zetaproteobacteria bacterium]|nr:MAG: four-helix bundle copper-binding protein [Zetaproteobacteria bacterium]
MHEETPLDDRRRALMVGAGAAALALSAGAGSALAREIAGKGAGRKMMHGRKHAAMVDAITHCIQAGNDCIVHCLDLIKEGDATIIDCLRSAEQMRNFCQAHAYLAASDSPFLDDACRLAIEICGDCKKECDKHAKKHAICKACADACAGCVDACKKHLHLA